MTTRILLTTLLSIFLSVAAFAQSRSDCDAAKSGKFLYLDVEDTSAYIIINGADHTEYYNNGKYYIKSKLTWTNDCAYIMTMTEITLPDFPFHPGDKMKVEIIRIKDDIIYYKSTVKDQTWPGRLRILSLRTRQT